MLSVKPLLWIAVLFVSPHGQDPENPWIERVPAAVAEARRLNAPAAYREALEVAWRGDAWRQGEQLAREALDKFPQVGRLHGAVSRALWRAGALLEAERVAQGISHETEDRVALATLITIHAARGQDDIANKLANRLAERPNLTAEEIQHVIGARVADGRIAGLAQLVRQAVRRADPANGYPEIYIKDELSGLADFIDAIGPEPVNQIAAYGAAPMPVTPLINLPGCQVMINGHGPYRMIVDTGGSVLVALDEEVARECGLKSIAPAMVRGVSGKDKTGQVLLDDLRIGDIRCHRVVARTFAVRRAVMNAADGIIGTGIFAQGRLKLDFASARMEVLRSCEQPGDGNEAFLRVIADAKLLTTVEVDKTPAIALLDSGADVLALAPSKLKELYPDRPITTFSAPALGVGSGNAPKLSITEGVDLAILGRHYENTGGLGLDVLDTLLGPILGVHCDVLAGMIIFRDMKSCTIDYPRCRLWVDWIEHE